jgi:large subunit ribosomal protein L10
MAKEVDKMPTEAKRETIAALTKEAQSANTMIVSEYRGLRVSELGEIRRSLRKQNVTYHVVKNRLMKIAAKDADKERLAVLLEGPTAVAFGAGNEALMAKAVIDALRPYRLVKIKGGLVGKTALVDADGIVSLSMLPPREALLGQLAGTLAAPMSQFVGVLSAPMRELAAVMQSVAESKGA